jgi:hypothetical protein
MKKKYNLSRQKFIFSRKKTRSILEQCTLRRPCISANSVHCTSLFILEQIDQHVGKGRTIDATDLRRIYYRSQFGTSIYDLWMSIIDNHGWFLRAMDSSSPSPLLILSPESIRMQCYRCVKGSSTLSMWEKEMWPWFEREAGQKASVLWLVPAKRDMAPCSRSRSIDPSHDLSCRHFVSLICMYINLHNILCGLKELSTLVATGLPYRYLSDQATEHP